MCLKLQVAKQKVRTLVDTGACRSLMKTETWRDICRANHRPLLLSRGLTLKSLSGHVIPSKGKATVNIYGANLEFYIVDKLGHDVLLGSDALDKLRSHIDYESHQVKLAGKWHPYTYSTTEDIAVYAIYNELDAWMQEFPELFSGEGQPTGKTDVAFMHIDTGEHPSIRQRPYRIPITKKLVVERELEKMLAEDIVEPSSSPWASPITLVTKKDGGVRFCVDFRKLNSITKKDAHPLPHMQDIFDSLAGSKVFSTLDLKSGFWQIPMDENSVEKTAFITHKGLFQFKRMPFGLCNASAVFQRVMNKVLSPFIGKFVMVYIDDIVIYSKSPEEHEEHLRLVFKALQDSGLKLKPSKCNLRVPEVKLLGFIIDEHGRRSDPEKTAAIDNMVAPKNASEVRSFLGMTGYHRHHIPNYAELAYPLVRLTKKYAKFRWNKEEIDAWDSLKKELVSERVMAHPQLDKPYRLYTDASAYSVGAILVQLDDDGVERPVMYLSKQLSSAQMKYATIEREAFAVVYALQKLRPYLYGAEFVILTDHKPLKSLFLQEQKNTRIQRWAVLLAEYGAPIEYRRGAHNTRADMLSRIHHDVIEEPSPGFISAMEEIEEIPWEFDQLEGKQVKEEQQQMVEYELGLLGEENYVVHDGLLYTLQPPPGKAEYPRLVLPPSARFRVIRRAHAEVAHQGMRKTLDRLQEAYMWPSQRKDVYKVMSRCAKCAVNRKRRDRPPPGEMPVAQYPCQIVGMDMSGPYPISKAGNSYALSLIDHCTGWVEVKPLPRKTAENVLRYLESEYLPRYGAPEVVIMDNGLEFKNHLVKGYLQKLGVDVRHCTPHHPQSNGKIERFHKTLKGMLAKLVNARGGEWEECLGPALWGHRVSTSVVTGYSPYFLTFGRKPAVSHTRLLQRIEGMERDVLASRIDELSRAFKDAARNTEASRAYNRDRLAKNATADNLRVGDHVGILASDAGQLDPRWDHGYVVTHIRGPVVKVVGPQNRRRTLNRDKVKMVHPDSDWGELRTRLTRTERTALRKGPAPAVVSPHGGNKSCDKARGVVIGKGRRPIKRMHSEHATEADQSEMETDSHETERRSMITRKRRHSSGQVILDHDYKPPYRYRRQTESSRGQSAECTQTDRATGPWLRSHKKRSLAPSAEEQQNAKRRCIAAVIAFCSVQD